jgi:signal transduction histidine kinase
MDLIEDIVAMTVTDEHTVVTYSPEMDVTMRTSNAALHQILLNLVSNSVKYGDKDPTTIHIDLKDMEYYYLLVVEDNARGISSDNIKNVFKLFFTAAEEDRNGTKGTGIGLATAKRLLDQLQATIEIASELGKGTKISMKFPKELH